MASFDLGHKVSIVSPHFGSGTKVAAMGHPAASWSTGQATCPGGGVTGQLLGQSVGVGPPD